MNDSYKKLILHTVFDRYGENKREKYKEIHLTSYSLEVFYHAN